MSDLATIFGGGFDTNSVPPQEDFEPIPPGKYPVLIEAAEVKQTRAGNGHYLKLKLQVLDGPYKGRIVFDNINIQNPNQQCQEIGLRTLAALGKAIGLNAIGDTAQLLNQCCIASVKVKDGQNEVRTYAPLTPAGAPSVPQVPVQPQGVYTPPAVMQPPPPQPYPPPSQYPAQPYAPPAYPQPQPSYQVPAAGPAGKPPWAR